VRDLRPADAAAAVIAEAAQTGPLDVLVNSAGVCHFNQLGNISAEEWDEVQEIDLRALFLLSQAFAEQVDPARGGRIINLGSNAGRKGRALSAHYAAAKAAVASVTESLPPPPPPPAPPAPPALPADAPEGLPVALLGALFVAEDGKLACRVARGPEGARAPGDPPGGDVAPLLTTVWAGAGGRNELDDAHTEWHPATAPRSEHARERLGRLQAELGIVGVGNLYTLYVVRPNPDRELFGDKEWIAALPDTPLAELRLFPEYGGSPYMPDDWDWQEGWWYPYSTFRPATPAEQAAHAVERKA